jgi:tetratricopeptide (TPR) repeat protein
VNSLLALNQLKDAAALAADYHAKLPDSVPVLVAYSEVILKHENHRQARDILTRVLERQPYLSPQNMALAKILWASGEYEAGAACLKRVVQVDAKHLPARALLGEYHLRRSDPHAALPLLDQAWALAPSDLAVRRQLVQLLVVAHGLAARHAREGGDPRTALAHFDQAAALAPDDAETHAGRAQVLVQLGDYDRAAEALEKLAVLQPENPTVLLSLGDLRMEQGRRDLAIRHWAAARDLVAPGDDKLRAALDQRLGAARSAEGSP